MTVLDAKVPAGPIADKWENHKFSMKLVNPSNKRKFTVIVVGTGLAGASAGSRSIETKARGTGQQVGVADGRHLEKLEAAELHRHRGEVTRGLGSNWFYLNDINSPFTNLIDPTSAGIFYRLAHP